MMLSAIGLSSCNEDPVLPPVPIPDGGLESVGSGSWDNPISTYQAIVGFKDPDGLPVWVTGYIVGWIDTDATASHSLNAESARFTVPTGTETNLLIAQSADETDWTKCATVQLPSGPVRNALNLSRNPGNLGKLVTIKGETGSKYCGAMGVRSVTAYNWGDEGIYEEPQEPVPPVPGIVNGVTFTRVSDIDGEGQYLLVFEGNKMAGPVEPSSYSYGYLPVKSVSPDGDNIVTSTLNSFYFYKAGEGWQIRDAYGRYVWWDSDDTHKSFQLTTNRGSEGMEWSTTSNADGTVAITNIEFNYTIQFSSQFSNVSAYKGLTTGPMPVLYKRAN